MRYGALLAVMLCAGLALPAPAPAQTRCKAPKEPYEGQCLYPDEIAKLKEQAKQPAPVAEPAPQPLPAPVVAPSSKPEPKAPPPEPSNTPAPQHTDEPDPAVDAPSGTDLPSPPARDHADHGDGDGLGWQRITAIALGGVAVVGVGVGIGFAVAASSKYDESDRECDGDDICTQKGLDIRSDAFGLATGADVAFVIAGIALAGGVVLWLTAPDANAGESAALELGPGGALLRVRW